MMARHLSAEETSGKIRTLLYCGGGDDRYTHCTLVLLVGTEVCGAISDDSLATLESRLGDDTPLPPPLAA